MVEIMFLIFVMACVVVAGNGLSYIDLSYHYPIRLETNRLNSTHRWGSFFKVPPITHLVSDPYRYPFIPTEFR